MFVSFNPIDTEGPHWKMCKCFDRSTSQVLDVQFGYSQTSLKLVSGSCLLFVCFSHLSYECGC